MEHPTLAIDVMGADKGPEEVLAGVQMALRAGSVHSLILVGNEAVIQPILGKLKLAGDARLRIHHCTEVIGMDEKPIQSLKQKKDASLVQTVELVKAGTAAAAVSCGNTGALMACSTLRLRPLEGVTKPALATVWPSKDTHFVLLDGGANPVCKPENLVHYAILGNAYARDALGLEKPRVGLLSIGTEEGKGNDLINETHPLLKKMDGLIHYVGLVEGFDLFRNEVDVVVCDGYTGNVVLKSCEGLYKMMKGLIKEEVTRNPLRLLGAGMMAGAFRTMKRRVDPDRFGGAPLLGLRGNMLKAHGSSNRLAISNALRVAGMVVERDLTAHSVAAIATANERMKDAAAVAPTVKCEA